MSVPMIVTQDIASRKSAKLKMFFILPSLLLFCSKSYGSDDKIADRSWRNAVLSTQESNFLKDVRKDILLSIQEKKEEAIGLLNILNSSSQMGNQAVPKSLLPQGERSVRDLILTGIQETNQRYRLLAGLINTNYLKKGVLAFPPVQGLKAVRLTPAERTQIFELERVDRVAINSYLQKNTLPAEMFSNPPSNSPARSLGPQEDPAKLTLLNQKKIFYQGQLKLLIAKFPYLFFLNSQSPNIPEIESAINEYLQILDSLDWRFKHETISDKELIYMESAVAGTAKKHGNKYSPEFVAHLTNRAYRELDIVAWSAANWMHLVHIGLTGCAFVSTLSGNMAVASVCGVAGVAFSIRGVFLSMLQYQLDENLLLAGLKNIEQLQLSQAQLTTRYVFLGLSVFFTGAAFVPRGAAALPLQDSLLATGVIRKGGLGVAQRRLSDFLAGQVRDRARFVGIERTNVSSFVDESISKIPEVIRNILATKQQPETLIRFNLFLMLLTNPK